MERLRSQNRLRHCEGSINLVFNTSNSVICVKYQPHPWIRWYSENMKLSGSYTNFTITHVSWAHTHTSSCYSFNDSNDEGQIGLLRPLLHYPDGLDRNLVVVDEISTFGEYFVPLEKIAKFDGISSINDRTLWPQVVECAKRINVLRKKVWYSSVLTYSCRIGHIVKLTLPYFLCVLQ